MPNERAGATAQVLLCEQVDGADGPVIKGTIAWCGDSSLMMTDMSQGGVAFNTVSHTAGPDHQDEDLGTEVKQLMVDLVRVRSGHPLAAIGTHPVALLLRGVAERAALALQVARDGLGLGRELFR